MIENFNSDVSYSKECPMCGSQLQENLNQTTTGKEHNCLNPWCYWEGNWPTERYNYSNIVNLPIDSQ